MPQLSLLQADKIKEGIYSLLDAVSETDEEEATFTVR
jgi:hypothetical protein